MPILDNVKEKHQGNTGKIVKIHRNNFTFHIKIIAAFFQFANPMKALFYFLTLIETDTRITMAHVSVYMSLWKRWQDKAAVVPLSFFRGEFVNSCKVSSCTTFHRVIKELHAYGYIIYKPSYNRFKGCEVWFVHEKNVAL